MKDTRDIMKIADIRDIEKEIEFDENNVGVFYSPYEIRRDVSKATGYFQKEIAIAIEAYHRCLYKALLEGKKIRIPYICVFEYAKTKPLSPNRLLFFNKNNNVESIDAINFVRPKYRVRTRLRSRLKETVREKTRGES